MSKLPSAGTRRARSVLKLAAAIALAVVFVQPRGTAQSGGRKPEELSCRAVGGLRRQNGRLVARWLADLRCRYRFARPLPALARSRLARQAQSSTPPQPQSRDVNSFAFPQVIAECSLDAPTTVLRITPESARIPVALDVPAPLRRFDDSSGGTWFSSRMTSVIRAASITSGSMWAAAT